MDIELRSKKIRPHMVYQTVLLSMHESIIRGPQFRNLSWKNILPKQHNYNTQLNLTITREMATCTFYPNALRASRVNDGIKMTRNRLMIRNFSTTKKLPSCLMPAAQKMPKCFFKQFPQCNMGKCTSAIFFIMGLVVQL